MLSPTTVAGSTISSAIRTQNKTSSSTPMSRCLVETAPALGVRTGLRAIARHWERALPPLSRQLKQHRPPRTQPHWKHKAFLLLASTVTLLLHPTPRLTSQTRSAPFLVALASLPSIRGLGQRRAVRHCYRIVRAWRNRRRERALPSAASSIPTVSQTRTRTPSGSMKLLSSK